MFYIGRLRIPSFPIGLLKTESGFIVRSVKTRLGRWTLVVVVMSVDAYPFFGFRRADLSNWGYWNRYFLVPLCRLIVRRPNLEVVTKRLLHQPVKIPGQFKCYVRAWKCIPAAISSGVNISEVPGRHLLQQTSFQWGSQKLLPGLVSRELTAYLSLFCPI